MLALVRSRSPQRGRPRSPGYERAPPLHPGPTVVRAVGAAAHPRSRAWTPDGARLSKVAESLVRIDRVPGGLARRQHGRLRAGRQRLRRAGRRVGGTAARGRHDARLDTGLGAARLHGGRELELARVDGTVRSFMLTRRARPDARGPPGRHRGDVRPRPALRLPAATSSCSEPRRGSERVIVSGPGISRAPLVARRPPLAFALGTSVVRSPPTGASCGRWRRLRADR